MCANTTNVLVVTTISLGCRVALQAMQRRDDERLATKTDESLQLFSLFTKI